MEQEEKVIFVPSEREWNDAYTKFEDMFDTPREEERRKPSKASIFFAGILVMGLAVASVWPIVNFR